MVDFVVRDAAVNFFNSDLSFHSGKSSPKTEVRTIPEREVTVMRSVNVESVSYTHLTLPTSDLV